MGVQSNSAYSVTQDNPMMLPASQYQGIQPYANIPPSNAGASTSYYNYQSQQAIPGDGYAASPSYPYSENQYQDATGDRASSSRQHGRDGAQRKKKTGHHRRP